ncbi:hypothetical protein ACIGXM_02460 [Kitasatospora sp. NPDC052896]|uniref:hypothetical protein n=1 Tax=Kitasatospora sp. NPDC052896 TaxID=3364061 RepID=UPI0037C6AB05
MASANLTAVPPPMAAPGYGKRTAPGQSPRHKLDFAHLPERERFLAGLIDRLPEGAAIDVKTLAKEQPRYGQQAVRSALNALSEAGHLRRIRENVGEGRTRWVFRTYFSRAARDDAWWARFLDDGTETPSPDLTVGPSEDVHPSTHSSPAYDALATLGFADARMALSARECEALEPLAAEWLDRGATVPHLHVALTAGLPLDVHSPGAFARRRLTDKLPPVRARTQAPAAAVRRRMECTNCRAPGRPESLSGGLCRVCHGERPPARESSAPQVRARVAHLRSLVHRPGGGSAPTGRAVPSDQHSVGDQQPGAEVDE